MKGKVDFLTLGSPMGLHYMQRRLLGMNGNSKKSYPELIRWVNFSAEGDVTALNENLKDSFYPMLEPGLPSLLKTIAMGYTIFSAAMRGLIAIAHMAIWRFPRWGALTLRRYSTGG